MRYVGFCALVAWIGFASSANAQSVSDFVGTWLMDTTRSDSAHQVPPIEPTTIKIALNGTELTVETLRRDEGSRSPTFDELLRFNLNGVETVSNTLGGPVKVKAHLNKEVLELETAREIQGATVTTRYLHTLNGDGREMKVDKTLTVQHGYEGVPGTPNSGHGTDTFVRQ